MDAAALNNLIENKNGPLIAILYDEKKIQVFRKDGYTLNQFLEIDDWSKTESVNKGFIILLPNSDFLVVAK